jgi:ABC-2 type transport system permease protein
MSRLRRVRAEAIAGGRTFLRSRTAVFFTFVFPVLLVLIFGVLVSAEAAGGLFGEPAGYYVPGYIAVVVLFTPLSRIGAEVARHRDGNRFEKLATTPLRRWEWLLGHTAITVGIIAVASAIVLALIVGLTDARVVLSPTSFVLLGAYVVGGVLVFSGIGALLGSLADTQDGVIAASNSLALPLLFLSETFVPPRILPAWFRPVVDVSPLTYFARGVREVLVAPAGGTAGSLSPVLANLAVVFAVGVIALIAGAMALPRTD